MSGARTGSIVQQLRRSVLRDSHDALSDSALLQRYVADRDGDAFAVLVERHGPLVWGVCQRVLRNTHDADDAFQAAFLVLARKAGSVWPREKLASWLHGFAHRTAIYQRSARAVRQSRERRVANMPEPLVRDEPLWESVQPLSDQEIARLGGRYRDVVILCDLQGHTRRAAARRLRIPAGTVASRVATARKLVAKRLARLGLPVSGGVLTTYLLENVTSACASQSAVSATVQAIAANAVAPRVAALAELVVKAMLHDQAEGADDRAADPWRERIRRALAVARDG